MGISQAKFHKRRSTGGRVNKWRKKRKYELGRPAAMTKIGAQRVRPVRVRGGNQKMRALRLDIGNFSWPSERCTKKSKILDVVYNASNNELVRTKTIVKNAIVKVDASVFKKWYEEKYSTSKSSGKDFNDLAEMTDNVAKKKNETLIPKIDPTVRDSMKQGFMYACISSRPGQVGRADGYILEGKELDFYRKKMDKKKQK